MRRKIFFFVYLILFLVIYNDPTLAQTRTVVAVLDLHVSKDIKAAGAVALSNIISDELIKSSKYIVADRRNVQELLKEMGLQQTGITSQERIVEVGKILNVQKMVTGNIGKLGQKYIIDLRLIDVETGSIESSLVKSYIGPTEGLESPVAILVRQLIGLEDTNSESEMFIYVSSNPKGAKIYVNDQFRGNAPIKVLAPNAGAYTIRASTSGYENWVQKVMVKKDETIFVNASLAEEKGYRFKIKRDGPLLLGTGSAIAAIVFRIKANGFYEDQKNAKNLETWRRAKDDMERNDRICYILAGVSVVSLGYSLYGFLWGEKPKIADQSLSLRFSSTNNMQVSVKLKF